MRKFSNPPNVGEIVIKCEYYIKKIHADEKMPIFITTYLIKNSLLWHDRLAVHFVASRAAGRRDKQSSALIRKFSLIRENVRQIFCQSCKEQKHC